MARVVTKFRQSASRRRRVSFRIGRGQKLAGSRIEDIVQWVSAIIDLRLCEIGAAAPGRCPRNSGAAVEQLTEERSEDAGRQ